MNLRIYALYVLNRGQVVAGLSILSWLQCLDKDGIPRRESFLLRRMFQAEPALDGPFRLTGSFDRIRAMSSA